MSLPEHNKSLDSNWYTRIKCSTDSCEQYCEGVIYIRGKEMETAHGFCAEHSEALFFGMGVFNTNDSRYVYFPYDEDID